MRVDKFYRNSFILTMSNLVTGMIGFIFSILLSKNLGAEGLGLYGLIMPVYNLLLCLTTDGLVTALSKISAVYCNKKDFRNLNRTLTTISIFILLWASAVAFLVFINSTSIASHIIKDSRAANALKIISPALLFVPMSAILKGYFYGIGKFKIPAFIDTFEKLLRVAVLLGTVTALSLRDMKNTVTVAYLALSIGELTSFILLYLFYKVSRNKYISSGSKRKNRLQLLFDVLVISCPLCLNGFISSILSTTSALVLPRRLIHAGMTYNSALALIGKFTGMALNITFLPFIIVGSMLTVLIPDLSESISRNDSWATETRISQVLKISYLVAISTLIVTMTIPGPLGMLFYNRGDLGGMIRFAALASFVSYVSSPTFSILNGLGKQNINLRNSLIVSVQGLVLIFILTGIPSLNIYGYGLTLIITSLTALILNIREIKKFCNIRFPKSTIAAYAIIGFFSYLFLLLFNNLLPDLPLIINVSFTSILGFVCVFSLSSFV